MAVDGGARYARGTLIVDMVDPRATRPFGAQSSKQSLPVIPAPPGRAGAAGSGRGDLCALSAAVTAEAAGVTMQYDAFRREYIAGGLSRKCSILPGAPVRGLAGTGSQRRVEPHRHGAGDCGRGRAALAAHSAAQGAVTRWFVFYTNYGSAKAAAIAHNPRVSLLFPWNELDRQVIVGGLVEKCR